MFSPGFKSKYLNLKNDLTYIIFEGSLAGWKNKINSKQKNTSIAYNRQNCQLKNKKRTTSSADIRKQKKMVFGFFHSLEFGKPANGANSKVIIVKWARINSWLITQVRGDWRQLDGLKMQWRLPGERQQLSLPLLDSACVKVSHHENSSNVWI